MTRLVSALHERGTGAERQRAAYRRRESVADVVDLIVAETAGTSPEWRGDRPAG